MDGEYGSFQFLSTKVTAEKKSASRVPMKLTKKATNYTHNLTLTCEWLLNQIPKTNAISILLVREHLRAGFEGPQKGPKFACLGREQDQNNGTLLAWPGVLEPEQKGTTPKHGHRLQAALQHWSTGEARKQCLPVRHEWVLRFSKACWGCSLGL